MNKGLSEIHRLTNITLNQITNELLKNEETKTLDDLSIQTLINSRKNLSDIKKGYDVIIISKRHTGETIQEIKYQHIEKDLKKTFSKAGMIN